MDKYVTIAQAAELLKLSPARVYQLIEKYKIKTKYVRGIRVCREYDILGLNEPTKNK